jgi:hypothetical protein
MIDCPQIYPSFFLKNPFSQSRNTVKVQLDKGVHFSLYLKVEAKNEKNHYIFHIFYVFKFL